MSSIRENYTMLQNWCINYDIYIYSSSSFVLIGVFLQAFLSFNTALFPLYSLIHTILYTLIIIIVVIIVMVIIINTINYKKIKTETTFQKDWWTNSRYCEKKTQQKTTKQIIIKALENKTHEYIHQHTLINIYIHK